MKTGSNIDCVVVFAAELTYKHGISSVAVRSADERGDEVNLYRLHFLNLLRGRIVGDFHGFGALVLSSPVLAEIGVSDSAGFTFIETAAALPVESGPSVSKLVPLYRLYASVSPFSRASFGLFQT